MPVPYSIHSRFCFVDLEDIAEAARIVLTEPNHKSAIYELAGTTPISHVQVAEIFGHVLNRSVRAERSERLPRVQSTLPGTVRQGRCAPVRSASERDEYAVENLVKMFEYYDQWGLAGNPNVLRWLLKREPTSLQSFVERTKQELS